MERRLDLHGLTWAEAREEVVSLHNRCLRGDVIDVIHGYGASGQGGKIRTALRTFLGNHGIEFLAGEDIDGNRGHTFVPVEGAIPTLGDRLQSDILDYCAVPKTKAEITGRFRRHGDPVVDAALRSLLGAKLLRAVDGRKKQYVRAPHDTKAPSGG